jgi:hypothetical protein
MDSLRLWPQHRTGFLKIYLVSVQSPQRRGGRNVDVHPLGAIWFWAVVYSGHFCFKLTSFCWFLDGGSGEEGCIYMAQRPAEISSHGKTRGSLGRGLSLSTLRTVGIFDL